MGPRVALSLLLACALWQFGSTTAAAELKLVYKRREIVRSHGMKPTDPVQVRLRDTTITVGIGDRYVYELSPEGTTQCDFEHQRFRTIGSDNRSAADVPLCALVDFREREFRNRQWMNEALAAAKIGDASQMAGVLDLEIEFGLRSDAKKAKGDALSPEHREGTLLWTRRGETTTACDFADTAFTSQQDAMFGRYLTYFCRLHPDVRAALLEQHRLPRRMFYRWRSTSEMTTVELTLASLERTADSVLQVPKGLIPDTLLDAALYATLQVARERLSGCGAAAGAAATMLEAGRQAAEAGRALDAVLGWSEYMQMACTAPAVSSDTQCCAIRRHPVLRTRPR